MVYTGLVCYGMEVARGDRWARIVVLELGGRDPRLNLRGDELAHAAHAAAVGEPRQVIEQSDVTFLHGKAGSGREQFHRLLS